MRARRFLFSLLVLCLTAAGLGAQKPSGGPKSIEPSELKDWLSYIASDELQGRQIYTEGLGLAAGYVSQHLAEWGLKPAGEDGSYFQTVKVLGVRTTSNASVTIDVNGQKRTFKDGEGITFPRNMGGKQTITGDQIQFVGYGLQLPSANIDDYANIDPKGKVIVFLGFGPKTLPTGSARLLAARSRSALEKGAAAVIAPPGGFGFGGGRGRGAAAAPSGPGRRAAAAPGAPVPATSPGAQAPAPRPGAPACQRVAAARARRAAADNGDFTTVQRYDLPVAPSLTAQDEFLDFLFSGSDMKYSDLKELAAKQEPLPPFALKGVKMTINVDADYTVVTHAAHAQRRGHHPGHGCEAERLVRGLRRAPRSHRLFANRRRTRIRRRRRRRWRVHGTNARDAQAWRHHQQRSRR